MQIPSKDDITCCRFLPFSADFQIYYAARCRASVLARPAYFTYLCLFARSEHKPSTKERHRFLSVAILARPASTSLYGGSVEGQLDG